MIACGGCGVVVVVVVSMCIMGWSCIGVIVYENGELVVRDGSA